MRDEEYATLQMLEANKNDKETTYGANVYLVGQYASQLIMRISRRI